MRTLYIPLSLKFFCFICFFFISTDCESTQIKQDHGYWSQYFQEKLLQEPHNFVKKGENLLSNLNAPLTIIDLGSGAGQNIRDFLKNGATVHAYDVDPESLEVLQARFQEFIDQKTLSLHQKSFESITKLPKADAVIAWRSLSFMAKEDFLNFWPIIKKSIKTNGLFIGTFFGEKHYLKRGAKSLPIHRLNRREVLNLFKDFQMLTLHEDLEFDEKSSTSWETPQHEHVFKIIAKK
jgi:SAM-dependent methyltransferase